jgi:hypothetical protein
MSRTKGHLVSTFAKQQNGGLMSQEQVFVLLVQNYNGITINLPSGTLISIKLHVF